jgi:hypothetical protein
MASPFTKGSLKTFVDRCSALFLTQHPAVVGATKDPSEAGVNGLHCQNGIGVLGESTDGKGVMGTSHGAEGVYGETFSDRFAAVAGISHDRTRNTDRSAPGVWGASQAGEGVHGETHSDRWAAVVGLSLNREDHEDHQSAGVWASSQAGEGLHAETNSSRWAAITGIQLNEDSPAAALFAEHRGSGTAGFFKGNVVVTGDITLTSADCAEQFEIGSDAIVEPGTVMVIDEDGALRTCEAAYDKRVAGVIAGAGDCKPAIILGNQPSQRSKQPIALLGRVYCKADARYGPITVGDLLTTSPTPGHAMKADDREKAFGSVLGKALRGLADGQGLIPVLIALQ